MFEINKLFNLNVIECLKKNEKNNNLNSNKYI